MSEFTHFKAKKRLGQNFLTSETIVREMVDAANIAPGDYILEVGPGKGIITRELLSRDASVVAIEKDQTLAAALSKAFSKEITGGRLEIIEGDALNFRPENNASLAKKPYKIVANIPYYITGRFLRTYLEAAQKPRSITVIVQKEVADRIVRKDGKGSILSESVRAFGVPTHVKTISARYFKPKPEVDSAIIHIDSISGTTFKDENDEATFFTALKAGFAHKRKLLASNLAAAFDKKAVASAFAACAIDEKARPEDLTHDAWLCLAENLRG